MWIWLYPEKASIKLRSSCPEVESIRTSIRGRGKLSFGHAMLRSVKSTHILHFPLDFFTKITLARHWG